MRGCSVRSGHAGKLRSAATEAGAEIVELAFILPVLLMLLLGLIWMARAYNVYQTITRAAREGARYAVLPSCASCGNTMVDTYTGAGTPGNQDACIANPTNVFNNYVLPSLQASSLGDPTSKQVGGSYCQEAVVMNQTTTKSDSTVQQCGVQVIITYPLQIAIPFTTLKASTLNISTQVQMRMENQSLNLASGNLTCP
jgi:TadE-like protein